MGYSQGEPDDNQLRELLRQQSRITVVGLSPEPSRPSYGVARYLLNAGYEILGVRPGVAERILNCPIYPDLRSVPGPLGIIDVFRRSDAIPVLVEEILAELPRRPPHEKPIMLWLQQGIRHDEAEARARNAGLHVVSDRCLLVEHARLF